jgi:hypothetical protein
MLRDSGHVRLRHRLYPFGQVTLALIKTAVVNPDGECVSTDPSPKENVRIITTPYA